MFIISYFKIVNLPCIKSTKTFTFNMVFGDETTQAKVYNETVQPIVDAVLEGYNDIMDEWMD